MASIPIKVVLFGSSYAPLAVIFFFLYLSDHTVIALVCLGIAIASVAVLAIHFEVVARRQASFMNRATTVQTRDGDVLSYIATYLIPFVTVPFMDRWQEGAALLVFIAILAVVYVNSSMLHVNPILAVMTYHLYEITLDGGTSTSFLLARGKVRVGQSMEMVDLADGLFLRVKARGQHGDWNQHQDFDRDHGVHLRSIGAKATSERQSHGSDGIES